MKIHCQGAASGGVVLCLIGWATLNAWGQGLTVKSPVVRRAARATSAPSGECRLAFRDPQVESADLPPIPEDLAAPRNPRVAKAHSRAPAAAREELSGTRVPQRSNPSSSTQAEPESRAPAPEDLATVEIAEPGRLETSIETDEPAPTPEDLDGGRSAVATSAVKPAARDDAPSPDDLDAVDSSASSTTDSVPRLIVNDESARPSGLSDEFALNDEALDQEAAPQPATREPSSIAIRRSEVRLVRRWEDEASPKQKVRPASPRFDAPEPDEDPTAGFEDAPESVDPQPESLADERQPKGKNSRESAAPEELVPLSALAIRPATPRGELPANVARQRFQRLPVVNASQYSSRMAIPSTVLWDAPAVCHGPLWFEDPNLERQGYSAGVFQPFVSTAHFFGTVPIVPYLWGCHNQRECIYTLGHYAPGSGAPYTIYYPPPSLKGAAAEAGVVTGLILLIP